jgi:zinc protease
VTTVSTQRGLAPTRVVLPNGLVVLAKHTATTPAVTISLAIAVGSALDPVDAPGTVFLVSRLLDRGTSTRSADSIALDLDNRGISLNVRVTRHQLTVECTCLREDFDSVLELLADIITAPSFPELEVDRRKGEILTSIRQDEDNPYIRAALELMARLYPGHPYGRPAKGTAIVVERLVRNDLVALHRDRFAPQDSSIAVVGDVETPRATDAVLRVLGGWRGSSTAPPLVAQPESSTERQRIVIRMMNKAQADIAYGFVTIARRDPAYTACWLANHVFGQYSIGGRLGDSIREKQGMAYYVSSALDPDVVAGPLVIRAGVSPANVDRAVASIDEEISRLRRDGLTQKELDDSRRYLIGAMPRALETNPRIAHFLQDAEFYGQGLDYDQRLPGLMAAVTLQAANEAAQRMLDADRATLVIAGPYSEEHV